MSFFFLKSSCVFSNAARHCRSCRTALHADDGHSECVSCLGKPQKSSVKGPSTPFSSGCSLLVSNTVVNTGPFPERMAHLSPVRGRANIPQVPLPQPLRVPGSQSKFCQELTFSQPTSFVPGSSFDSVHMRAMVVPEHALAIQQLAYSFKIGASRSLKTFQRMLGLSTVCLLRMRPLKYWLKPQIPPHAWCHGRLCVRVSQPCVTALAPGADQLAGLFTSILNESLATSVVPTPFKNLSSSLCLRTVNPLA